MPGEGESAQSQHGAPASNETTPSEGDPTPDEAAGGSAPKATPLGYGWTAMVTGDNFDPGAVDRVGSATSALAGQTIRAIVTDPNVRVRSDDLACASCHDWANAIDRAAFCARTDAFMVQPVAKEDGTDPPNAKPRMLRSLLFAWRAAGCP